MRILMFGWEFPPHISGGLGTACHGMTRALSHHGADIVFVIPRAGDGTHRTTHVRLVAASRVPPPKAPEAPADREERIRHLDLREADAILRPYLTEPEYARVLSETEERIRRHTPGAISVLETTSHYGRNLMAEVARYSEVAEQLALRERFDVIHAHDWMTFPAGLRARQVSGRPLVVHVHALEFDRSGDKPNPDVFAIEKLGLQAADHVIAVSHYTRSVLIERYGVPADKITVVHNAVSRRHADTVYHVKRPRGDKVVLFLGRVTFQKGPDYFVEAAARVIEKAPNVTFVMAGSGDMLPRLIERVGQLRLGRHFHFTGFLRGEDVERMYAQSDLYVMPSVSEPFGISPLEAMLYDVPVIISRHAGVGEVLTHALKVDFWDVTDMANKILAVLKYPALSRELLRNGRRELQAIRWDVSAERILSVYQRVTS
jgi:glycosyltransferase involved in cell wall biosynthesis